MRAARSGGEVRPGVRRVCRFLCCACYTVDDRNDMGTTSSRPAQQHYPVPPVRTRVDTDDTTTRTRREWTPESSRPAAAGRIKKRHISH